MINLFLKYQIYPDYIELSKSYSYKFILIYFKRTLYLQVFISFDAMNSDTLKNGVILLILGVLASFLGVLFSIGGLFSLSLGTFGLGLLVGLIGRILILVGIIALVFSLIQAPPNRD